MNRRGKRIAFTVAATGLVVLLVTVSVLLLCWDSVRVAWLRSVAFQSQVRKSTDGTFEVLDAVYSRAMCAVLEIGHVRIAVPGHVFMSTQKSSVQIPYGSGKFNSWAGSAQYRGEGKDGALEVTFCGFTFVINSDGNAVIDGISISIMDPRGILIMVRDGRPEVIYCN
jgi:hypothetical protein